MILNYQNYLYTYIETYAQKKKKHFEKRLKKICCLANLSCFNLKNTIIFIIIVKRESYKKIIYSI